MENSVGIAWVHEERAWQLESTALDYNPDTYVEFLFEDSWYLVSF